MAYRLAVPSSAVCIGGAFLARTDATVATPTKVKEIVCPEAGAYRLMVTAKNDSAVAGSWVAFYRDGALIGNTNPIGGDGAGAGIARMFVESSGPWKAGQKMQVYTSTAAGTSTVQNFQIWAEPRMFELPPIPAPSVNLD